MGEAENFWSEFETQTGEKVAARSMGIWHESGEVKGLWGIIILTDKAFRFKYIPSNGLLLGLFKAPENRGPRREALDIVAPLERISLVAEAERGWLARLFGSPFRKFQVAWSEASGSEPRRESFSVDPSGGFLAKLRAAADAAAG